MNSLGFPKHISFASLQHLNQQLLALLPNLKEPQTYEEVVIYLLGRMPYMQREFDTLEANQTLELITLPPGKKAISCKWVYKI